MTLVIEKTSIAHLNVYCPNSKWDYRISINLETPASRPSKDMEVRGCIETVNYYSHLFKPIEKREKDRVSYRQDVFQVDLTSKLIIYLIYQDVKAYHVTLV